MIVLALLCVFALSILSLMPKPGVGSIQQYHRKVADY